MVLVSYTPYNHISLLQTKFRYREGHETRRVGLEAMPLDEPIESGHRERQARLKIRPAPMHHLLQRIFTQTIFSYLIVNKMVKCYFRENPSGYKSLTLEKSTA